MASVPTSDEQWWSLLSTLAQTQAIGDKEINLVSALTSQPINLSPSQSAYALQFLNICVALNEEARKLISISCLPTFLPESTGLKPYAVLLYNCLHWLPESEFKALCQSQNLSPIWLLLTRYIDSIPPPESDHIFEWIVRICRLFGEKAPSGFSLIEAFFEGVIEVERRKVFLELYIHACDSEIASNTYYSLVEDMPAELIEKNSDVFKKQGDDQPQVKELSDQTPLANSLEDKSSKDDKVTTQEEPAKQSGDKTVGSSGAKSLGFRLRRRDVEFLVGVLANEADLGVVGSAIKILISATFLGGYNRPLQKLVSTNLSFIRLASFVALREGTEELPTNSLRLAANLVHADRDAQNRVIDQDLIPQFLGAFKRDEENPHTKEVIVVFVRYMTEGNLRARDIIKNLKVADYIKDNASFMKKTEFL